MAGYIYATSVAVRVCAIFIPPHVPSERLLPSINLEPVLKVAMLCLIDLVASSSCCISQIVMHIVNLLFVGVDDWF